MLVLAAFLQANIIPIYFVYGLVHFITGFAVALETGRTSQLRLFRALPFLAAFGITHGINEWIEMLSMISAQIPTVAREPEWAEIVKIGWKGLSFFCLLEFGVRLLIQLLPQHKRWLRWIPMAISMLYLAGILWLQHAYQPTDVFPLRLALAEEWTNYSIGLPGSILTVLAMLAQRRAFLRDGMPQFGREMVGAALAIGWYALLDQIIDVRTPYFPASWLNSDMFLAVFGLPIEVFRILAIAFLAIFVIRMLRVFEVEYARRLDAANQARFAAQEIATRELMVMFETCRILGTSLDMQQLLDESLAKIVTMLDPMIAGIVYLHDRDAHGLVRRACQMRDPHLRLALKEDECAKRAAHEAYESGAIAYDSASQTATSFIAVPLIARGDIVGALCLAHRAAFSNYAVIQTLARQLGIALENARLYAEVQQREYLRGQLLERAVAAQEEERKRIARELHDETGQMLTALAVGLGGIEETIAQNPPLAQKQIAQLKTMTMSSIDSLRQFVADLRPSVLDDMGLVSALRWFAQQYAERTKLQVEFQVTGNKCRLPLRVETVLFRIAQEGLNNVGRHARATQATVRLEFAEQLVTLTVQDNGRGFIVQDILGKQGKQLAWGLLGVQERVELVGGKFSVESVLGRGTTITVQVPMA